MFFNFCEDLAISCLCASCVDVNAIILSAFSFFRLYTCIFMVLSDSENSYSYREVPGNAKFTRAQAPIAIEIFPMEFNTGSQFVCTRQLTAFSNDVTA